MYCRRCGYENEDGTQICVSCGKTVVVVRTGIMQENVMDVKEEEKRKEEAAVTAKDIAAAEQKNRGRQGAKWVAAALVVIGAAGAVLEIIVSAAGF